MGKSSPGIARDACRTLGKVVANSRSIQSQCEKCEAEHEFTQDELRAMLDLLGADYLLVGRRFKCHDCGGWRRLYYLNAFWWPLWSSDDSERWLWQDEVARLPTR